jgi:AraC-like DNA-binding protein
MQLATLNLATELDTTRKQLMKYFMVSILGMLVFYASLYYYLGFKTMSYVECVFFGITCYVYYIISKFNFNFEASVDIAIPGFTLMVYIKLLIFWKILPIEYLWFFSIPLAVLIVKPFKSTIYWTAIILTLSISVPFVSDFFDIYYTEQLSTTEILIVNYSVIVLSIYLLVFFLYFMNEFQKLKLTDARARELMFEQTQQNLLKAEELAHIDKFEELYLAIEKHFVNEHPYRNPDFNINTLATHLNKSVTHISKALNQKNDINFKSFVNTYRINEVKLHLNKGEHETYTLKHIYTMAGFTQQTTFNRIFREVEGVTPSEYIESLQTKNPGL